MGERRCYLDGFPRPLVRGWLHFLMAVVGYCWIAALLLSQDQRSELILMILCKTLSYSASAYLHIPGKSSPQHYALANCADFFLLPFNGGSILAVATPRSQPRLRLLHAIIMVGCSVAVIRPVFRWTLCSCARDDKGALQPHMQRTAITVGCGLWVLGAWLCQAGFQAAWLGYTLFILAGYAFWNGQHMGMPPLPWHGRWWAAHDDFHVFGFLAEICTFIYALPAATAMARPPAAE
mmetsp:Transcript_91989/g.274513  ORF Transcript_91989/g.274513 Transcript_91989/m.274513 type:complete len:236 (-) Transcript_91989:14-721(-)